MNFQSQPVRVQPHAHGPGPGPVALPPVGHVTDHTTHNRPGAPTMAV